MAGATLPHQRKYQPRNYGVVSAGCTKDSLAVSEPVSSPTGQHRQLLLLAARVAALNPDSPTIGAGMLASLVADARRALGTAEPGGKA